MESTGNLRFSLGFDRFCMAQNRLTNVAWGEPSCAHENCWFCLGFDRLCVAPNRDPDVAWGDRPVPNRNAHMKTVRFVLVLIGFVWHQIGIPMLLGGAALAL